MQIWAVSEVNRYVKGLIEEDSLLRDLWVEGEISNFTVAMSGHAYFTLKDALSQLRCVMFRAPLQRARVRPNNGDRVIARGPVRVYEPQGQYQLAVEFLAPAGLGELQLRLEELKNRLEAEGLFDESRKRPLPRWPHRIGVVTSSTGAVIHDIRTVIARRWPLAELVLAPTPVQGDEAPPRICEAIADLNDFGAVDVIVVARGGGSLEDLWAFNDETVARAIFASRVPVVSAIGHETDVTIADLVADQRAATPSAAAELLVPDLLDVQARVVGLANALAWHASRRLQLATADLNRAEQSLYRRSPQRTLAERLSAVEALAARVTRASEHALALVGERLRARELQLTALDPQAILKRGFGVTWRLEDRAIVRSVTEVEPGVRLRTRVADGTFDSVTTDNQPG